MGKNRGGKAGKRKNVFKVDVKRASVKSKGVEKKGGQKKANSVSLKKKRMEEIKAIDQQLINLRSQNPGMQTTIPSEAPKPSKIEKIGKKQKVQVNLNDDTLKQLKI